MMGKVNFFVVGAPKCGTTTLYHFLNAHGQVDFGRIKEPHLFATDLTLKGSPSQSRYHASYDFSDPQTRIFGDASVMHLYSADAAENIKRYHPSAKILIMVRSPVGFIQSYHHEQLYNQIEDRQSLQECWNLSERRQNGVSVPARCPDGRLLDYKSIARFDVQIQRFIERFPPDQVRIGFLDDMHGKEDRFIAALYSFLDIDPDGRSALERLGASKSYKRSWHRELIKIATNPRLQAIWKTCKRWLGINRRLRMVRQFRVRTTVSGEKLSISEALASEIAEHYSENWAGVQRLAVDYGLLNRQENDGDGRNAI